MPDDQMVTTFGLPGAGQTATPVDPANPPTTKTWRAVQNVALWYPAKVTGTILFSPTGETKRVEGEMITPRYQVGDSPEYIAMSGAVFETALPPLHEKNWLAIGAIVPMDANVHLNLEDVFPQEIATQLRQNGVFSLEDVASEKPVQPIYSWLVARPEERQMRQFLLVWSRDNQQMVDDWIAKCKALIAPPPEPAPPVRHEKRAPHRIELKEE